MFTRALRWPAAAVLPNPLASRRSRLAAFFCLYLGEGMPLGFAVTAVATHLRREGVSASEIGVFVAALYLPWGFKWLVGPMVDGFGSRRAWILGCQVMMALTLLSLALLDTPAQLSLFTALLLVHNVFGATQDVAIDALACQVLRKDERGTASGLMFAGTCVGQAIGGAGMLFVASFAGFQTTFLCVAAVLMALTMLIVLPMAEDRSPRQTETSPLATARALCGDRAAMAGLLFAVLPAGAMSLGLTLQSDLAVDLGLGEASFALLQLISTIFTAIACVVGGWLSDRFGRRRMQVIYVMLMSLPVICIAALLHWQTGQRMPAFWIACLAYSVFQGLGYAGSAAIFMELTQPRVAATQFTAYMALQNLSVAGSAMWQGHAVEAWGYPATMGLDALIGLAGLALLPLMNKSNLRRSSA